MKKKKLSKKGIVAIVIGSVAVVIGLCALIPYLQWRSIQNAHFDFDHTVPPAEAIQRTDMVRTAESWLGTNEADGSHRAIIDLYNSHEPLAQGYAVQYDDNWCATFVSAVAIELELTDIVPTECGCQRQIQLFKDMDCWVEDDDYLPLPGDIIYYCMKDAPLMGDCTGWSDHVGIVVGTYDGYIKVIEGNKDDDVSYRILPQGDRIIRGYGVPNYGE